jgi:hypothetical protein
MNKGKENCHVDWRNVPPQRDECYSNDGRNDDSFFKLSLRLPDVKETTADIIFSASLACHL